MKTINEMLQEDKNVSKQFKKRIDATKLKKYFANYEKKKLKESGEIGYFISFIKNGGKKDV